MTLVFGQNNAGKSSIARIIPSLVNSCSENERLAFNPVTLSDWTTNGRDFVYGKGNSTKLKIGFVYESNDQETEVQYEIFNMPELEKSVVSRLTFKRGDDVLADFEWDAASVDPEKDLPRFFEVRHQSAESNASVALGFQGLMPSAPLDQNLSTEDREVLNLLRSVLLDLTEKTHWLGPLRHTPDRIERRLFKTRRMTSTGKEASQILAHSHQKKTPLFEGVSNWFETSLKHRLTFIDGGFDGDALFGLALSPLNAPSLRIPIADTGTGIAQVLPIIVLGELAALGELGQSPILIFENPELHLHDSVHDDLGRFFAKITAASSRPMLMIETHSENILLAIQIAIAEKELLYPADVSVNWVRRLDDGSSTIDNVYFDSTGAASSQWPLEAFSTAPEQAKKLFSLRQKNNQH